MTKRPTKIETGVTAPARLLTDSDLAQAVAALARADPAIARMAQAAGQPPLRRRAPGLEGLAWIIVSQQMSTASAAAIHARLRARFGDLRVEGIAAASDDDLRACGLSAPKMRTLRAVGAAIADGTLDLAALERLDADAARQSLTRIKGIGPWSADVYLLFCVGHPDVWPAGDLALQEAARMALRLDARPDARQLEAIGERWRPWRAAAARLLWAYHGAMRANAKRGA